MRKPVIGVMPLMDVERESYWMLPGYMEGILEAGGIPVMFPLTPDRAVLGQLAESCDGFLFTGGHDVSPEIYGEEILPVCGELCPQRDEMEKAVLQEALRDDRPVLGICRGIQFLNAFLGGTLYQDLPSQHPSETGHHQSPPYDRPVHDVRIEKGTSLHALLEKDRTAVNSYHHQAIRETAPGLEVMAYSEDGLAEAVRMPDQSFVWAVQWHPEFSFRTDEDSRKIFRAFVEAAERKMEGRVG